MAIGKARQPELVEHRLSGLGVSEIAKAMGVSTATVSQTLTEPHVVDMIAKANEETMRGVLAQRSRAAAVAFSTLLELAGGRPMIDEETGEQVYGVCDVVRRQASSDLLDRCGVTKETAVKVTGSQIIEIDMSGRSPEELRLILSESDDND